MMVYLVKDNLAASELEVKKLKQVIRVRPFEAGRANVTIFFDQVDWKIC